MAEERLIDDDKDRKYKVVKNEDGEDELIVIQPDEEEDSPAYDFSIYDNDEELTDEQLAEREKARKAAREAERARLEEAIIQAEQKLEEGDFESALYNLTQVEDFAGGNGRYYCLKLKILTRNFTDFVSIEKCAEASDKVKEFADSEQKAQLKAISAPYEEKLKEVEDATNKLYEENESKKAERREAFKELKGKAAKYLAFAGIPFAVFFILLIAFGSMWASAESGVFLILTIVFAALSFIALIFTLITSRKFLEARRRVLMNEKDTSTKLGREYLKSKAESENLRKILSSFENDLS